MDLDTSSLRLYWNMLQRFGGEKAWRRLLHVLRDVADKHETSISSVAIQWVMAQGGGKVASPIIGERFICLLASNYRISSMLLSANCAKFWD